MEVDDTGRNEEGFVYQEPNLGDSNVVNSWYKNFFWYLPIEPLLLVRCLRVSYA